MFPLFACFLRSSAVELLPESFWFVCAAFPPQHSTERRKKEGKSVGDRRIENNCHNDSTHRSQERHVFLPQLIVHIPHFLQLFIRGFRSPCSTRSHTKEAVKKRVPSVISTTRRQINRRKNNVYSFLGGPYCPAPRNSQWPGDFSPTAQSGASWSVFPRRPRESNTTVETITHSNANKRPRTRSPVGALDDCDSPSRPARAAPHSAAPTPPRDCANPQWQSGRPTWSCPPRGVNVQSPAAAHRWCALCKAHIHHKSQFSPLKKIWKNFSQKFFGNFF